MIDEIAPLFRRMALPGPASHAEPWRDEACRRGTRFRTGPFWAHSLLYWLLISPEGSFPYQSMGTPVSRPSQSAGGRETVRPTKHTCFGQTFGYRITPNSPDRPAAPNGSHPRPTPVQPFPRGRRPPLTVKFCPPFTAVAPYRGRLRSRDAIARYESTS